MQTNILEYLETTAARLPNKVAFSDGTDHITFAGVWQTARAIGSALLRMGHGGRPIAVLMEKHPTVPAAFWGVVYAGGFYVPLDPAMPPQRMERILQTVGADCLIADEKGADMAGALAWSGRVLRYTDLAAEPIDAEKLARVRAAQLDTDPIYVVFTSGSTGTPKGVVACHRSVLDYTEALSEALGFDETCVFANQTPLFFDAPLKELMPVIKFGATAYFVPRQLFLFPMKLCDFLNAHHINTICWVVSALTMISSLGVLEKNPPKDLRTVAFGSEVFPPKQYALWRKALPQATFFNLYGPTEATGMSCYWRADRELEDGESIPIGRPFRNTGVLLLDAEGRPVRQGEIGEIYLRGTCVTQGYYNDPERTAAAFVRNPLQTAYAETVYRTGDLAAYNRYGELVFHSRADAQIKHQGHRIELGEIEAAAERCGAVRQCCCVYDDTRKRIVLFYAGEIEPADLVRALQRDLPRYMLPALCKKTEALPLTPNGKIDRKGLRTAAIEEK